MEVGSGFRRVMNTFLIRGPCLTLEKLAMKKSLIALAVLTASGISFAQSSVTLFGIVDAAYAKGTGSVSDKTQLQNSGYNSSRFGVRGTEDLGGGLKASFWLEAGVNNDDGTGAASNTNNQAVTAANAGTQGLTFNRRSTVSLEGGFGEVRLGRDYTPQFWTETAYDPFGTNGVGHQHCLQQRWLDWRSCFQQHRLPVAFFQRPESLVADLHGRERFDSC